jgi:hypothetical protein
MGKAYLKMKPVFKLHVRRARLPKMAEAKRPRTPQLAIPNDISGPPYTRPAKPP